MRENARGTSRPHQRTKPNRSHREPFVAAGLKERIAGLIKESQVPTEFSSAVLQLAETFGTRVSPASAKNRRSLIDMPLCTIDGETAKDFDDAVCAQRKERTIEVTVAIADVSYYVQAGSELDKEAERRATSIYYPGACIPMLPENLSNGLCSLKPGVLRLALAVSFEVGPKGGIVRPKIFECVIKSHARLTYTEVQNFYDRKDRQPHLSPELTESLHALAEAARLLRSARTKRGAIDFDIVESVVSLDDDGEPTVINPLARLETHRIIEDLMVATNEIVAEALERKHIPSLYRVHESPSQEKLEAFFKSANAFGVLGGHNVTKAENITEPKDLAKLIKLFEKSKYKDILTTLLLRCMMQAHYSEKNLMHFGLASTAYSHFTSPIRRYADLVVHRQIRNVIFEKDSKKKIPEHVLQEVAQSISDKEIRATDLERKIVRLFATAFMSRHVGEEFDATIVSVAEFGLFVRVTEHHIEGLVHISAISRSHVTYVPEKLCLVVSGSNQQYMVGDKVRVVLKNVSIDRGFIDFELLTQRRAFEPRHQPKKPHKPDFENPKRFGNKRRHHKSHE